MSGKKRKGLSVDDKRRVILSIYHEKQEPFNLKEIENLGAKQNVVQQTIKEINQSLVDDFLVCMDKIGAANFFWSFPSKACQDQVTIKANHTAHLGAIQQSINDIDQSIGEVTLQRQQEGRPSKLRRLQQLQEEEKQLDSRLEELKFNDPAEIKKILQQADINKSAAERWTDNIWTIKTFLTKKKGMPSKEADKILKIDGNFDYPTI